MIHLPNEIWIHIFKHMDLIDMFEMRKICPFFKNLVDYHIPSYYHFHNKRNPFIFELKPKLVIDDLVKGAMLEYILTKERLSKYCFMNIIEPSLRSLTTEQLKKPYSLVRVKNISIFFSKECYNFSSKQINNVIGLKKIGFPDYFAVKFGKHQAMNTEKLELVDKLFKMGISDYFCGKIATEFSEDDVEMFFRYKEETGLWFVHIAHMIRPDLVP